jgi:hypothetical protein
MGGGGVGDMGGRPFGVPRCRWENGNNTELIETEKKGVEMR